MNIGLLKIIGNSNKETDMNIGVCILINNNQGKVIAGLFQKGHKECFILPESKTVLIRVNK